MNKEKSNLNDSWQKKCKDLMSRYPEVASTIECSAKLNFGVLDVFVSAQKVSSKHAQTGPDLNRPQSSPFQNQIVPNPNYLNPNCPKRTQNSHKANGSASNFSQAQTASNTTVYNQTWVSNCPTPHLFNVESVR